MPPKRDERPVPDDHHRQEVLEQIAKAREYEQAEREKRESDQEQEQAA